MADAGIKDALGKASPSLLVRYGPSLEVTVRHYSQGDITPISEDAITVWALVDTGAGESCIDDVLARKLRLPVTDRRKIAGASGPSWHDVYMGEIYIPATGNTIIGPFTGVHLIKGGQQHGVLLGRTFLNNKVMIYDGVNGTVRIV